MSSATPPSRTPRAGRRLWPGVLLLAVVLAGAALVHLAGQHPAGTATHQLAADRAAAARIPAAARVAAAPPGSAPTEQEKLGRELFLRNCAWCHGQDGSGSQYGPSLIGVGAASADFQLSTGRMPLASEQADPERGEPAFSPAEIDALTAYVAGLGEGPPIPQIRPGDPVAGRTLYLLNCASCHSSTGTGAVLPGGRTAPELYAATPTQIAEAIRVGPGLMPQYPEHALSTSEVEDVVAYVERLGTEQDRGGAGLGRLGPVAEGLVAWLVAVPVLLLVIRRLGKKAP